MKVALILFCLLSSCARYQSAVKHDFPKTKISNQPFDKSWQMVLDWLSENGVHIKNTDKTSGLIVLEQDLKTTHSYYYDCGTMGWQQSLTSAFLSASIHIKSLEDGKTKVIVNAAYKGERKNDGSITNKGYDCDCESRGGFESEVLGIFKE